MGIDSGCLRADIDVHTLGFQLMGSFQGYIYMPQLKDWIPIERAFVSFWSGYVLPSITVRKGESR